MLARTNLHFPDFLRSSLVILFLSLIFLAPSPCPASGILSTLETSDAVLQPERMLQPFRQGAQRVSVLVMLRQPEALHQSLASQGARLDDPPLAAEAAKARRRNIVAKHADGVIAALKLPTKAVTTRFQYMSGFAASVTPQELLAIVQHPEVLAVEENARLHPSLAQGIPLMAASVPRGKYRGENTAIAICDSGVDYTHPMLGGGGFPNAKVIGGYDTGMNRADPMDLDGHGTSCAGIAAGSIPHVINNDYIGGVAPEARIYALKITKDSGEGSLESMLAAWEWSITHQNDDPQHPILVIATSFGGLQFFSACDSHSPALATAAANANAAGIAVFAPSGNNGWCDSMELPACLSNVISVGAVYDAGLGDVYVCVDEHSCATKYYDPDTCPDEEYYAEDQAVADMVASFSNSASFLDLLAPSFMACTTDLGGGYNPEFSGTSAATPYAAGAALLLQQASRSRQDSLLTPAQVRNLLVANGEPIQDDKVAITMPRVNLSRAIAAIPLAGAIPPVAPNLLLLAPEAGQPR